MLFSHLENAILNPLHNPLEINHIVKLSILLPKLNTLRLTLSYLQKTQLMLLQAPYRLWMLIRSELLHKLVQRPVLFEYVQESNF